jgi:hypothetical protein
MQLAAAALIVSTAGITYMLTAHSLRPTQGGTVAQATPTNNQLPANTGSDSGVGSTALAPVDIGVASAVRDGAPSRLAPSDVPSRQGIPARLVSQSAADRAHSDLVYGREIEMLQKIVSQRRTQLDSSTVAIIERNLQIIDVAIEQSRAALARDPASHMLDQQLTHALDKKVELLRTAAMLPVST